MSTLFLHTMLLIRFLAAYANRDSQKRLYYKTMRNIHRNDKY